MTTQPRKSTARKPDPAPAAADELDQADAQPVDELDDKDRELAELRAEVEGLRADPPALDTKSDDPRDKAIAALKAERDLLTSTPKGAEAELRKALAALTAEVERMKSGQGLVPVPEQTDPDPYLYWARLASGRVIEVQHPHPTHHFDEEFGEVVPIRDVWAKAAA